MRNLSTLLHLRFKSCRMKQHRRKGEPFPGNAYRFQVWFCRSWLRIFQDSRCQYCCEEFGSKERLQQTLQNKGGKGQRPQEGGFVPLWLSCLFLFSSKKPIHRSIYVKKIRAKKANSKICFIWGFWLIARSQKSSCLVTVHEVLLLGKACSLASS